MANIKVAVRVRPISARELNLTGSEVVVRTDASTIFLTNLKVSSSKAGDSRERTRRYGFDYCFDSSAPGTEKYANQSRIYETLGQSVLDALFTGYNACFVAYGQSASGKTYTMMGSKDDPGLTPRLCEGLFSRMQEEQRKQRNYRVSVSYLEIYNDRVRDLLKPAASASGLKVREHPRLGPYVQGLTHHVVGTLGSLMSYVEEGTRARKTALTLQNSCSSRSHALLTVSLFPESANSASSPLLAPPPTISAQSSRRKDDVPRGGGNKLHLVDLAGSESAATCSGVNRLKEGANINKSLVALGNVISALAERGSTGSGPGRRFIPYRDSSLTWLLKDALGGNATTIMLATISPASGSYNETAHTLRFAQRAQSVVNRPVVNENPVARIIRELRDEVARLKSLLLEKENNDPGTKSLCCCKEIQTVENPDTDKGQSVSPELRLDRHCMELKNRKDDTERTRDEKDVRSIRRFNSTESLSTSDSGSSGPIRKFGSFEFLTTKNPFAVCNYYNRAKVTELNDEEDEIIDEINEPVFVDIPTLVAVLIKPDDSLQGSSTQIEEICSDEVQEDSIDVEFLEHGNDHEVFESTEKLERIDSEERSSANADHVLGDDDSVGEDCQQSAEDYASHVPASSPRSREKGKFHKQDSIDVVTHGGSSNLHTSKRFGSVEGLQKKKESYVGLERSHTNLEKRPAAADRAKKLNNIREIDDQKAHSRSASVWRGIGSSGSKDQLQRKGSNDSDKSLKESNGQGGSKSKNGAVRKPSLENLKRKTSKDSSSSSSKEEQIVISSLTRDKLLGRKGSLDQEPPVARTHTPIQRVKRAEIVAAVTERLYASRKHVEDSTTGSTPGSGTRSPPEATDVKLGSPFTTRTKLQEISRKMLSKRRRVCVDTQTDNDRTVRVKDMASLTDEPQVICQDAAVLTDHHENCELPMDGSRLPVLRVKEIATSTDKPRTTIVRCKDAESLANDLDEYDYEIHSLRNDSGILSDDTQNYAESNLSSTEVSDACIETDRRVVCTDSSTNTMYLSPGRSPTSQAPRQEVVRQQVKPPRCDRHCCNVSPEVPQIVTPATPEKNVISISLPDMISITIESTNGIESRIAMTDCSDTAEQTIKPKLRDIEAQTDEKSVCKEEHESVDSHFCFKDLSRSATSLTDGKIFRIENIFQDPKIASKACTKVDTVSDAAEDSSPRKSVTFTNSLGTSFVPDTRERATEMEREKIHAEDKAIDFQKRTSFAQAFVSKRCGYGRSLPEAPQSAFYSNSSTICTCPARAIDSAEFRKEFEIVSSAWQQPCSEVARNGLIFSCHNGVVCMATNNCVPLVMKHRQPEIPYEICPLSTGATRCHRYMNMTEPCTLKSPPAARLDTNNEYECNFSDDSLDFDEEDVSNDCKPPKLDEVKSRENQDNLCPPDVVAHTTKDTTTSAGYMDAENTESSTNSDFEDDHVELPRKKAADVSAGTKVHDYKSLILGDPLIMFGGSSVEEDDERKTSSNQSSGSGKKKVSFSNVTEERSQRKLDRQALSDLKQGSHVELKSIIKKKKKKKSNVPETLERSQSSTDSTSTDDSVHSKLSLTDDSHDSCAYNVKAPTLDKHRESSNSQDSDDFGISQDMDRKKAQFSNQEFEDDYTETDSEGNIISDEEYPVTLERDIVQEYLDQATTFMRNMNSINEYMNATKMLDRNLGRGKRRVHRRRGHRSQNQDYVEYQGRRISLKDDPTECISDDDDIVVPIESYERCLLSINRLENCIDRVNRHNELLREKYNINVESAGAKRDLARTSSDSTVHRSGNDNVKVNPVIEASLQNASRSSRAPKNIWLVDQADYAEDFDTTERHIFKQFSDLDVDEKNGNVKHGSDGDLEKRIFDQLMSVVESSRYTKRLRDRYPSATLDLRSASPPTYSRFRTRYRSDKQDSLSRDIDGCINLDRPASSAERNLYNTRTKNDHLYTASLSTMPASYESATSVSRRSHSLDNFESSEEDDLSVSDELTGLTKSKNVCRETRSYECDGFSRRIKDLVPSKRKLSSGIGASKVENSSPSDNVGVNAKSIDGVSHFRDKLKYPGSPRVKFLELLNERRRIVESTRGMSAS